MRRGRPQQSQGGSRGSSRPPSPEKPVTFDTKFGDGGDRSWKGLRPPKSGLPGGGNDAASLNSKTDTDAWSIDSRRSAPKLDASERRPTGFDNDFSSSFGSKFTTTHQSGRSPPTNKPADSTPSSFGSGFGDAFDPSKISSSARPPSRLRTSRIGKDAFDGLEGDYA